MWALRGRPATCFLSYEIHMGGYTGRKSSMRRRKAYAGVASVAPMYSRLHGLLCFSSYVVLYAWGGRVRYSEVHFVPVVRCVGCWRFTKFGNLSRASCRPFGGAACLVAFLLAARRRISFLHAVGIGWDAQQGAQLIGQQLAG